jgi:hypothetical protein
MSQGTPSTAIKNKIKSRNKNLVHNWFLPCVCVLHACVCILLCTMCVYLGGACVYVCVLVHVYICMQGCIYVCVHVGVCMEWENGFGA